jgi:hypothetical protein
MANELRLSISGQLVNGSLTDEIRTENLSITQAAKALISKTVSVTTSEADLDTTGVTNLGYAFIKNVDITNSLIYGPKNGSNVMEAFGRLKPGEAALLRLEQGKVLRWKSSAGTIIVLVKVYSD